MVRRRAAPSRRIDGLWFNNAPLCRRPARPGDPVFTTIAGISTGPICWVYIPAPSLPHRLLGRPVKPGDDTGGFGAMTPVGFEGRYRWFNNAPLVVARLDRAIQYSPPSPE